MVTKLLKRLVPTPLHRPIRGAALFLIPPLRRCLTRTWRRRNRPAEPSNQIHLINPLLSYTGAPLRTLHLFNELKDHAEVLLWSEHEVPSEIAEKYPVKQIVSGRFEFPDTGTFVIVSPQSLGPWIRYAHPRRTILIHNRSRLTPRAFRRRLRYISNGGRREVEVVYASEL